MSKQVERRKVKVNCLFCDREFESTLRWEGAPEMDYCSKNCEYEDEALGGEETYEKFTKGSKESEWG